MNKVLSALWFSVSYWPLRLWRWLLKIKELVMNCCGLSVGVVGSQDPWPGAMLVLKVIPGQLTFLLVGDTEPGKIIWEDGTETITGPTEPGNNTGYTKTIGINGYVTWKGTSTPESYNVFQVYGTAVQTCERWFEGWTRINFSRGGGIGVQRSPNLISVPKTLPLSFTSLQNIFAGAIEFNQDISSWDTSRITNMNNTFQSASKFNQDLSNWCVPLIPSKPTGFDSGATAWTLPKPVWGTCPPSL